METAQDSSITPVNSTAPPSIMETKSSAENSVPTVQEPAVEEGSKDKPISTSVEADKPYMKRPCPGDNNNDNRNKQKKQKKNKASKPDLYKIAYENVSFVPIPSTGRPGTPHSLFQESYTVHWKNTGEKKNDGAVVGDDEQVEVVEQLPQIVHKHANGLVIVTAGNQFMDTAAEIVNDAAKLLSGIDSVNYLIKEAPALNAGERRKIQSKMMHNKKITDGVVSPSSIMCRVVTTAGAVECDEKKNGSNNSVDATRDQPAPLDVGVPLYSCVWGAVMEINARLLPALLESETEEKIKSPNSSSAAEPNLLAKDPLLDGYLAIILPTGPFPPKEQDDERRP